MLRTFKLNMAETVKASDKDDFFVRRCMGRSLYLPYKASPDAALFGQNVLFDIPFIADWLTIGEHRQ
jgi:hypothetical protein